MFLRPPLVSKCDYDFMSGTAESHILRYNLTYRNCFMSTRKCKCKTDSTKRRKYLQERKIMIILNLNHHKSLERQEKHRNEYEKVKALDVELKEGMILYVPPYWWYSIYYGKMSSICSFKYGTFMNTLSILPELSSILITRTKYKKEIIKLIQMINLMIWREKTRKFRTKAETTR